MSEIKVIDYIPQRAPFLYLDRVIDVQENKVITETLIDANAEFFKGHFPGNPIMPGVLLCEACFQSGALLISYKNGGIAGQTAVVSRVQNAKFKNLVRPDDIIRIETEITETIANAAFFKSKLTVSGKTALTIEFACTLIGE